MRKAYAILWRQCTQYMNSILKSINELDNKQRPTEAPSTDLKMCIQLQRSLPSTWHCVILSCYSLRKTNKMSSRILWEVQDTLWGYKTAGEHIGRQVTIMLQTLPKRPWLQSCFWRELILPDIENYWGTPQSTHQRIRGVSQRFNLSIWTDDCLWQCSKQKED